VAITADHGEELWDHGGFEHPPKLYQELLAVPLLIHVPGGADGTVAKTVGLEAVGPTLLDRAGVETNRSVLPPWGNANDPVVSACAHSSQFEPMSVDPMDLRVAVRDGIQKYLRDPDGTEWLYNLATDPKEQSDRSTVAPDTTQTLATIADKQIEKFRFNDGEIPAELKDRLINLGYLE
jgi:arylsulfatase A-like enzyme